MQPITEQSNELTTNIDIATTAGKRKFMMGYSPVFLRETDARTKSVHVMRPIRSLRTAATDRPTIEYTIGRKIPRT